MSKYGIKINAINKLESLHPITQGCYSSYEVDNYIKQLKLELQGVAKIKLAPEYKGEYEQEGAIVIYSKNGDKMEIEAIKVEI